MNKQIKCPKCESINLALADASNEYVNVCYLLCMDCYYVFSMSNGKIEDNPEGNMKRLLKNLIDLNHTLKARHFLIEITGIEKKEAKDYINNLKKEK